MALCAMGVVRVAETHICTILRSPEVVTVKVHDFVPRRSKIVYKLLLGILTSVNFHQGPKLGVRTEDQVDTGTGPLVFTGWPITTLEYVVILRCLPGRLHVKQIHEEVISESLWPLGEDTVLRLSDVGIQNAQ